MTPEPRFVPRFAAEPPQELLPYGRWADTLRERFLAPRRRWRRSASRATSSGTRTARGTGARGCPRPRRHRPGSSSSGSSRSAPAVEGGEPGGFGASVDATEETAARHPEWRLDLNDEVVGSWRGEQGQEAAMTLVWGTPLVPGGAIATAELADLAVDQCVLREGRFTLLAPDDYRGDLLDVKLFNAAARSWRASRSTTRTSEDEER